MNEEKLDKLLAGITGLTSRMDDLEKEHRPDAEGFSKMIKDSMEGVMDGVKKHVADCMDSVHKRLDAVEKVRKDGETEKEEEKKAREAKERDDAAKAETERQDAAKAEQERKDAQAAQERHDAQLQEFATVKETNAALMSRLAALETHVADASTEDRAKFSDVWGKGEELSQFFGDSAGCPKWSPGETLAAYERRIYSKFKKYSTKWKDVDLANIADASVFANVAAEIFHDAEAAAMKAADVPAGQLRQVELIDKYSGSKRIEFRGDDDGATWAPFANRLKIGKFLAPKSN